MVRWSDVKRLNELVAQEPEINLGEMVEMNSLANLSTNFAFHHVGETLTQ